MQMMCNILWLYIVRKWYRNTYIIHKYKWCWNCYSIILNQNDSKNIIMICLNDNEIIIYANDDKILYVNDTEKSYYILH